MQRSRCCDDAALTKGTGLRIVKNGVGRYPPEEGRVLRRPVCVCCLCPGVPTAFPPPVGPTMGYEIMLLRRFKLALQALIFAWV